MLFWSWYPHIWTNPRLSIICIHNRDYTPIQHNFVNQLQHAIQSTHNLSEPTYNSTYTQKPYKSNTSTKWTNSPEIPYPMPTPQMNRTLSLPTEFYTIKPPKYNPSHSIYTNRSFIPLDWKCTGNLAREGVYSQLNNLQIVERLMSLCNILRLELYTIRLALANTQDINHDIHIFTNNLNNFYIINNHIRDPSSQHHRPYKLLIAFIIQHIIWF